ncbi:MAG: glutaminyl-peptide cyclotransferase, partial [Actinomycetota bacterium]|nr:glutaminyl-peptide cyclotransferase [Actinomycetota bacterium]
KTRLIMSNGTSTIAFRDPKTFEIRREIDVTDQGEPVDDLNELEWVEGEIFANVWQTDRIARINPRDGDVLGWIDVSSLREMEAADDPSDDVTNGIAYIKAEDRLFVTGKLWENVYEIRRT